MAVGASVSARYFRKERLEPKAVLEHVFLEVAPLVAAVGAHAAGKGLFLGVGAEVVLDICPYRTPIRADGTAVQRPSSDNGDWLDEVSRWRGRVVLVRQ